MEVRVLFGALLGSPAAAGFSSFWDHRSGLRAGRGFLAESGAEDELLDERYT